MHERPLFVFVASLPATQGTSLALGGALRAAGRKGDAGGLRYGQTVANLDLVKEYAVGLAKPLSVAFGAEFRREDSPREFQSYAIGPLFRAAITTTAANCIVQQGVFNATTNACSFPGRGAGAGAQGFPGIPASSATDVDRHSYAAYLEFDTNPVEGLTTTLAGRYEHFSDFGSTWNGKFAARFEPIEGYAVRGSISNGFRAPSLANQTYVPYSIFSPFGFNGRFLYGRIGITF